MFDGRFVAIESAFRIPQEHRTKLVKTGRFCLDKSSLEDIVPPPGGKSTGGGLF
jgi:hypothetical protein